MKKYRGLEKPLELNWQGLVDNILRKGTPKRPYHMELFHDGEIGKAIVDRFGLREGLDKNDPHLERRVGIRLNRFCGFDYQCVGILGSALNLNWKSTEDTADLKRAGGRGYIDEHVGPITNWEQFEKYPWPQFDTPLAHEALDWYNKNTPQDMCLIAFTGHFAEEVTWLMGYETLCYALFEQRDLVQAIADKLMDHYRRAMKMFAQYDRIKMTWATDDMGYKTGLMISPDDTRQFVLKNHKELARMSHEMGRPYLLHSCGKLHDIIDDLIDDVKIDAKHSWEDTIEDVRDAKKTYGRRTGLLGAIDVDFLCRSDEAAIRKRVRDTLDVCLPGGGFTLGTGNSVANYVPLENYLAMIDEGRLYGM